MDVSGERRMRRFGLALQQNLATLDAKQKIFQKNHNFNRRALKRDLKNIIISRRRMEEGDLDAWDSKKAAKSQELLRSVEKIAEQVEREKQNVFSESRFPAIKITVQETENPFSKSLENVFLPRIKTTSKAKSLQSLVPNSPVTNSTSFMSSERRKSFESQVDRESIGKGRRKASILDLPVINQEPAPDKTGKLKILAREISTTSTSDANVRTDKKVDDENNGNSSPKETPSSWRRLSVALNINTGRRLSIRRQSMTSTQVVHSFLEALQKKRSEKDNEKEKKKYDLSYLKECRYLRHNVD